MNHTNEATEEGRPEIETQEDQEDTEPPHKDVDPPPSCGERLRDDVLRTLDRPFFQILGILVLIGIVASGALFFFFLMGWQTLCRPRTDCEPRNYIYNASIQALNIFFTYTATISMPWRWTNLIHTMGCSCPYRSNEPGMDLYGLPSKDVWFHVSLRKRGIVLFFLIWNCLTQYANQATRIVYYNYELQNTFPGNFWTNIFFGLSMICAAIGGALMGYYTSQVRQSDPEFFGPGPIDMAKAAYQKYIKKETQDTEAPDSEVASPRSDEDAIYEHDDYTRDPRRRAVVAGTSRSSMRLFAM